MTAFKLKKKESSSRRYPACRPRADRARLAAAARRGRRSGEAVHEARKDLKKLRSALKLVRPVLGEKAYRRENERFRDVARELSDVRDAQVRAETVEGLAQRFPDDAPPGGWWTVRADPRR